MSKYSIEDTSLIRFANAVRNKTGITKTLTIDEMIDAIDNIFIYGKDILAKKNLKDWTTNFSFTHTINYSDDGVNKINQIKGYVGTSGYERLYLPIAVKANTDYIFFVDFTSPTGFSFGGYDNYNNEHIYVMSTEPSGNRAPFSTSYTILGYSEGLKTEASTEYKRYKVDFNSGSNTTIYLVLSFGYIKDAVSVDLNFKNLTLLEQR